LNQKKLQIIIYVPCSLSPIDNKSLAVAFGNKLTVYNIITNELICENTSAHENGIISISFHPLSPALITSGYDNLIKIWNYSNLAKPLICLSNPHWVWMISCHLTYGRLILTSYSASTVRLIILNKEITNELDLSYSSSHIDFLEFDESVYSIDWNYLNQWMFVGVSYNGIIHLNKIPDDIKFKIMID